MLRVYKSVLVEGSPANGNAVYYIEGACVNADVSELPTDGVAMGSKVYVVDDESTKYYNESTEAWS